MTDNVIKFTPNKRLNPQVEELLDELKKTVYKYAGQVSLAEVFGCIEIVKYDVYLQLLEGMINSEDES